MLSRCLLLTVVLTLWNGWVASAQDINELLEIVPDDANSIVILRVDDFVNSPLGKERNWGQKHADAYVNGSMPIPPWVKLFVKASYVYPGHFAGDWTTVVLPLPQDYDMQKIAEKEKSEVQTIADHAVVHTDRRNGYFVEFSGKNEGERILGGMAPGTRQSVARWIDEVSKPGTGALSSYLQEAAENDDSPLLFAIDFAEMLDPKQIRFRLSGLKSLEDKSKQRVDLTLDFQTLKGVQLAVHLDETAQGVVRFDFGRTIGDEASYVKDLLIELLNDAGAALDDLEAARVEAQGKSVFLSFSLSDEGLARLLSLATLVTSPDSTGRTVASTPASKGNVPAPPEPGDIASPGEKASLRYYKAVNHNVDGMEKAYKRINNYRQTAQWHDNFAKRIDELPIEGVDPELLDYGQKMSSLLRSLGASLRGMGVNVDALNSQIQYQVEQKPIYYSGADWWWGGAHTAYGPYNYGRPMETKVHTNLQDVRAKQSEIVAKTQPDRDKIWQMINEERSVTRRKMVAKYGSDFQD